MRYSEILGPVYYNIQLTQDAKDLADTFFSGASHHLLRGVEASLMGDFEAKNFHLTHFRLHVVALKKTVFELGDFSQSSDESGSGFGKRSSWDPSDTTLPDEDMFSSMRPDSDHELGQQHPADDFLSNVCEIQVPRS